MIEGKKEELKNITVNSTFETDFTENDLLSSNINNKILNNKHTEENKILSNKEVFDIKLNQGFKGKKIILIFFKEFIFNLSKLLIFLIIKCH